MCTTRSIRVYYLRQQAHCNYFISIIIINLINIIFKLHLCKYAHAYTHTPEHTWEIKWTANSFQNFMNKELGKRPEQSSRTMTMYFQNTSKCSPQVDDSAH